MGIFIYFSLFPSFLGGGYPTFFLDLISFYNYVKNLMVPKSNVRQGTFREV